MSKVKVLLILGGPASGKGTLCAEIVKNYGYKHLSAGDILRSVVKNKSHPKWQELEAKMNGGQFVSSEELVGFIKAEFEGLKGQKVLLDGFPRNQENVDAWNNVMPEITEIKGFLLLECSKETMLKRSAGRNEGRSDDKPEIMEKRIDGFLNSTVPCVAQFEKEGKVIKVNAEQTREKVFEDVAKIFKEKNL